MKKNCPKCGKFMKHNHLVGPERIIWFNCSCGYNDRPSMTTMSMRAETDLRRSNARAITRRNLEAQDR